MKRICSIVVDSADPVVLDASGATEDISNGSTVKDDHFCCLKQLNKRRLVCGLDYFLGANRLEMSELEDPDLRL